MDKNEIKFISSKGYELINDDLGSGSFGKTVLLKDNSIEELFVCKKYQPQNGIKKEDFYNSFKKEIKLMYKLNHPNVVRVYNYYLYDSMYCGYILMEYIKGCTIDKWFDMYFLARLDSNQIFRQLIEAFNCIEKSGIIHRDIRESNILVTSEDQVKIIDFGLGKNYNEKKLSSDSFNGIINRQPMLRFPNEFEEGKYTSKTDMFCLAELFYRLLKKYEIKDFEHSYILQKMMEADPNDRYNSFEEIIVALEKRDFKSIIVSEEDKEIYADFMDRLINCIHWYDEKVQVEKNLYNILSGINEILELNCFDYDIQDNSKLIEVFVKSKFTVNEKKKIKVESVNNFYHWILSKEASVQEIIIKNIVNKLNTIRIIDVDNLPF